MKIERNLIAKMSLNQFAEQHDLTMVLNERSPVEHPTLPRYWASFKGAEVVDGFCLASNFGSGYTEEEAFKEYAKTISGKTIVFNAYNRNDRYEIKVPLLV
jgi:hypothetical protein